MGASMKNQTVKCAIDRDTADFAVEVYYWEYKCVNNVVKKKNKQTLAYIATFRDHERDYDEQVLEMLALKNTLADIYHSYPDGEISIELLIRDEFINV